MGYHYTYIISCLKTNKKYYGVRSCNCIPEKDDYFGSSKYVNEDIQKYGILLFKKEIHQRFDSREEANIFERKYIKENKLHLNKRWYNKAVPPKKNNFFNTSGENNPMYGKSFQDNASEEKIQKWRDNLSRVNKERYKLQENRDKTSIMTKKGWTCFKKTNKFNEWKTDISSRQTNIYQVNIKDKEFECFGRNEISKLLNCSDSQVKKILSGWIPPENSKQYGVSIKIKNKNNSIHRRD